MSCLRTDLAVSPTPPEGPRTDSGSCQLWVRSTALSQSRADAPTRSPEGPPPLTPARLASPARGRRTRGMMPPCRGPRPASSDLRSIASRHTRRLGRLAPPSGRPANPRGGPTRTEPATSKSGRVPMRALAPCGDEARTDVLRKEVIQPQVPLRLPCYDLVPIRGFTFGACPRGRRRLRVPPPLVA